MPRKLGNDGRLHGKFNQDGTKTGRYSSNEPNLQNFPDKARQLIVAPKGKLLMGIDFSQIEPRVLAHITGDMEFRRPYLVGTDLYSTFASKVFNKPIGECGDGTKYRKLMKTGLLATIYGTQQFTLSKQLGVSIE
ncbi:DNA polymerase, partial [Clostridium perfringens]|uniref:DNA polymerase n=1 Tax=Clostridium perfringens TaxID=1502 RepID=UPI002ACC25E9